MFPFKKNKQKTQNTTNVRLAKKILGKDSGRRVFGFACSPGIQAQIKILADKLNIPLYALMEHMLQLSAELIAKISENQEENALLIKHLIEVHVEARTLEKISRYDEELAERLDVERKRRFEIEKAVRQIVIDFTRKGVSPQEIAWSIDYGMRCRIAIAQGKPIPRDLPPDD